MEAEICALAPSDWQIRSVEDVCKRVTSGGTPSRTRPDFYVDGSWPWVKTQELQDTWIDHTEEKITDDALANSSAKVLPPNTILLAMYGATVGQLGILRSPMTCNQACCAMIVDSDKADFRYLYHHLRYSRTQLKSLATGAAQQNLSGALIKSLLYPFPPLAEQKAIAAVLGALDDKIELNRRMHATLEAIARALFQSWFVDFDPVRAKLVGRPLAALDPATAALFPATFQDSEAGHIPKGWTFGKVSDLATLNRGAVNPGDFPTETFDHFSLPAFDNGRTPKVELGSAIMSNKLTVTPNSVLLSKLNPHIPRIWLPDLHDSRRSVCSTEFMVVCSKPGVSREYLFSLFTSSAFASIYGTLVTGTTGSHQRIRPESVLDMKIVIPPPSLIRAFTDIAKPMFDRINRNTDQSRTLATLRDTLLPKLLSGELSVSKLGN
ncbi:MAG: restriction endonuclease subunit S [Undibacterium sp.]|nr:restriction endonuclease subunit S [Opitutaceae bacterium]